MEAPKFCYQNDSKPGSRGRAIIFIEIGKTPIDKRIFRGIIKARDAPKFCYQNDSKPGSQINLQKPGFVWYN